jgi:hypothetical protein
VQGGGSVAGLHEEETGRVFSDKDIRAFSWQELNGKYMRISTYVSEGFITVVAYDLAEEGRMYVIHHGPVEK